MNALDLITSQPVSEGTFKQAVVCIQQNFGYEIPESKVKLLWRAITADGWSEERFKRVFAWFLKKQKYPNWTVADWFDYEVKVYSAAHVPAPEGADYYFIGDFDARLWNEERIFGKGVLVWKPADGEDLPFAKFKKVKNRLEFIK